MRVTFTDAVNQKLRELDHSGDLDAETQHRYLCDAITHAINTTLPDKTRGTGPQRKVCQRSRGVRPEWNISRGFLEIDST